MKIYKVFFLVLSFAALSYSSPNPAYQYCKENGGEIETRKDALGNEDGVCMWNNPKSECGQWAFVRSECLPGQCALWSVDEHKCIEPIL